LEFHIQEGTAQEWKKIVDTALPSPKDFSEHGLPLEQAKYVVAPRSVVILLRHRKSDVKTVPTAHQESSGRKQGNPAEREGGV
jgi:glycogen operon protein